MSEPKTSTFQKDFLEFLKTLAISFLIVFLLVHYVARPIRVQGDSMYPTLHDGAVGVANIAGLNLNGIRRFDVVIIWVEDKKEYLVKRVVGLPGETVSYQNDQLYINGQAVAEDFFNTEYKNSSTKPFTGDIDEITLGSDEYYCLGDNRPFSRDSRYYGPFTRSMIVAKGALILYPFNEFGVATW